MAVGRGKQKQRDSVCYDRKVSRMTKWHSRLLRLREEAIKENPALETAHRWKDLRPLSFYIDQIKKPVSGGGKK